MLDKVFMLDKEKATIDLMDRLGRFEVRLKEIEALTENLVILKNRVDLLTFSMETFITIIEPQKERKNGCLVGEEVLDSD